MNEAVFDTQTLFLRGSLFTPLPFCTHCLAMKRSSIDGHNQGGGAPRPKKTRKTIDGVEVFYSKSSNPDLKYLSNFANTSLIIKKYCFHTPEHAYHAAKCWMAEDKALGRACARDFMVGGCVGASPLAAKRAGSKASLQSKGIMLRPEWDHREHKEPLKLVAMRKILEARYEQDAKFREVLATVRARGARLLHFERSGSKSFWGGFVCQTTGQQVGGNQLGELLMELSDRTEENSPKPAAA